MLSSLHLFVLFWFYRYARLIINCFSHWTFAPKPIPLKPSFSSRDVTVVVATLDGEGPDLRAMLRTCLRTQPFEVILATVERNRGRAEALVAELGDKRLSVTSVGQANKRLQMCAGIKRVCTEFTVLADDDVLWPEQILPWMLAPMEDARIGGVGTCQRLRRDSSTTFAERIWNFLGAIYLERRNFDCSACSHMDGGVPCMSGRTVAYRTCILQDSAFLCGFENETWGRYLLNADDDNFVTRWLYSHGWKTYFQYDSRCELETTLENNPKFLRQCLRWSRSNWRSNLTSMFVEKNIWKQQPWSTYAVHQTTITAWALPWDIMLLYSCWWTTEELELTPSGRLAALGLLVTWMFLSKCIKLVGHFARYPVDLVLLPVSIVFGYFHGFIKLYAGLTMHATTWGSRENADADDSYRMIRLPPYDDTAAPPQHSETEKSALSCHRRSGSIVATPRLLGAFEHAEKLERDELLGRSFDSPPPLPLRSQLLL